jgi:hypothetical protein
MDVLNAGINQKDGLFLHVVEPLQLLRSQAICRRESSYRSLAV